MAIFVDIFMAACLLLALVLGVRQGFLQSLARVAIIIVALLGAAWLAEHLADPAAKWLEPMLTEKIQQQMDGQTFQCRSRTRYRLGQMGAGHLTPFCIQHLVTTNTTFDSLAAQIKISHTMLQNMT